MHFLQKILIKLPGNFLFVLPVIFIFLQGLNFGGSCIWPFFGTAPEPLNLQKLHLKEIRQPSYLHPLQQLEYRYIDNNFDNTIALVERATLFTAEMQPILGDLAKYRTQKDGLFARGFAVTCYPNTLFFITQYILVFCFVGLLAARLLRYKNPKNR